ncbi:MAG: hypothetical protein M3542_01835 [Acidobacteriota bacterium]|nr:hypothetical protein [Acidobacteriota bacterium]MDQ5872058.1 hypothetical protein [Acidobacteriota bacterium]
MIRFQVSLGQSGGNVLVNGNYVNGTNPVFVERVVVEELDAQGNAVGASTHRLNMSIDPVVGSTLLVTKAPSGGNVRGMRATAHFIEIDRSEKSAVLNL